MKNLITLLLLFCFGLSLNAQTGKVFDNLSHPSQILKEDRKYAIYLPPDYDSSQRDYPVLYLLHGAGDDHTGWVQFGEVLHITDKAIQEGKATSMIIVMPDGQTTRMGYFNDPRGDWNYEDYFFDEFMPYVENKYRIKKEKRYRAVAGLSMGGGGSFMYALHRPDLFSSACPLSAYIGPTSIEETIKTGKEWFKMDMTQEQGEDYFNNFNAFQLIKNGDKKKMSSVRWYIDCGDDDFLYEGNSLIHIEMRKQEIPHEYRVRDGGHTWTYWRTALPEVLHYVSQGFRQY